MNEPPKKNVSLGKNCPYVTVLFDPSPGVAIDSIAIEPNGEKFGALALSRFSRWGCLAFRNPPDQDMTAIVTVTGTNLQGMEALPGCVVGGMDVTGDEAQPPGIPNRIAKELELDSLRGGDEAQRRAARYFLDLDNETNPVLFGEKRGKRCIRPERCAGGLASAAYVMRESPDSLIGLEKAVRAALICPEGPSVLHLLWKRLENRRSGAAYMPDNIASRARIAYLSALLLDVLNDHYGGWPRAAVADAYARFACGDLFLKALSGWTDNAMYFSNGGPNSAFAFCFAEFAFLAIEMGIDAKEWKRHLAALVAVQEIYPLACGEMRNGLVIPIAASKYTNEYNFRAIPKDLLRGIQARYRLLPYSSLPIVSEENLRRAISGFDVLGLPLGR